jgi:hypothetical protein
MEGSAPSAQLHGRQAMFTSGSSVKSVAFVSLLALTLPMACSSPADELKQHDEEVLAEQRQRAEQEAARKAYLESHKDEIFKKGVELLKSGDHQGALQQFRDLQAVSPDYPGLSKRVAEAEKAEQAATRKEQEQQAAVEREVKKAQRLAAESILREKYLDQGLDIKVDVSGKNADRITLTYVLFNDVWTHRFQKDGGLDALRDMGFRRVDLKDGYDYHIYWTF